MEEVRSLFEAIGYIPALTATLNIGTCIHRTRMGRGYYTPEELYEKTGIRKVQDFPIFMHE